MKLTKYLKIEIEDLMIRKKKEEEALKKKKEVEALKKK